MLVRELLEVECRKFDVWSDISEACGHMGSCPGYGKERRQNHVSGNSESESEELLREAWQEKPG